MVSGIHLRQKVLQFVKERNGIRLPHLIKELYCSPPASIPTVLKYSTLVETINGIDKKILTQFITDANSFLVRCGLGPKSLIKYTNVVSLDTES